MENSIFKEYLKDLAILLKEKARYAVIDRDSKKQDGGPDYDYADGLLMAYHEVISLMQQQAEAFGIPLALVKLDDINPETELL